MGCFLVEEVVDAAAVGWAGGVVVGRGVAGRGAGTTGGSGGTGCAVGRSRVACADRVGLARGGGLLGAPVDLDGGVCAFDGGQAAHRLGLRDAHAGGLGLTASAPVLFDRARRAGASRVDGAQADPSAGRRGGGRVDEVCDRKGPARDALQGQGREDRLDGRGGRCALPERHGIEPGRREDAGARGAQADEAGGGGRWAGARSQPRAGAAPAGDLAHDGSAHRGAQGTGAGAHRFILPASTKLGNPDETKLLPDTARELDRLGLCPREVALDGGFEQRPTAEALHELSPERVFIAGRQQPGSRRTQRRLGRYRTGAEGRISHLKRSYGLRRSRLKGQARMRTWSAWTILAYNLDTLAIRAS